MQSIVVRADDPTTNERDGFIDGNPIQFKYCDISMNKLYQDIDADHYWGDSVFTKLGTYIANLTIRANPVWVHYDDQSNVMYLSQNRPNPFNNTTLIDLVYSWMEMFR